MVVACEIATHSFSFKEPESYKLTYLSVGVQEWGFGQVMAVVMLFLQLWDILSYPLQPSPHGGKRIVYWWNSRMKPFFGKRIILSLKLMLTN